MLIADLERLEGVLDAREGKEHVMKRAFLMVAALGLIGAALAGCRAEGEVDLDEATNVSMPQ